MSKGINKVILVGNLGADPETRYMPSGGAVTNIRVATAEQWKDKQTGEKRENTEWHRVVMFNRLGEIAAEYLRKGGQVYIEGRIQTRKWQNKDGEDQYTTEIVANEMQMLGGKGGASGGGYSQAAGYGSGGNRQPGHEPVGWGEPKAAPKGQRSAPAPAADDFDDDIPF